MSDNQEQKPDWIYLPENVEEISLWHCLHDGELISSTSNLLKRFVILSFRVEHLLDSEENATFSLKLDEVTSVRAIGHFRWVGKFEEPKNTSNEEREKLIKEYWAKWREESLSWCEFESALATEPLQIREARYALIDREITLRLGGFLDGEKFDDIYFDVFIHGKNLSASRSDGKEFNLESFNKLGKRYWEELGGSD